MLSGTPISISTGTVGASVYYTLDGSDPTELSTLYAHPIGIDENVTVKAIALMEGMNPSEIMTVTYTVYAELTVTSLTYDTTNGLVVTFNNEVLDNAEDEVNYTLTVKNGSGQNIEIVRAKFLSSNQVKLDIGSAYDELSPGAILQLSVSGIEDEYGQIADDLIEWVEPIDPNTPPGPVFPPGPGNPPVPGGPPGGPLPEMP
ncbi:hypothetical protein CGZ75_12380 [Paenibacillus herberti]|uniref:GH29D-like beta-sandwich domain-containing protein n=1 Tax=Paenibacillus herberti TaxID=1619309 RepID=A0A229P5R0_9BACL|nr:hypothetical protein CGZ75_12380 [Paenibacillus herberti]